MTSKQLLKLSGFILSAVLVTWIMFGPLVRGALSVEKLDEGIYSFEFTGNDGFDGLIRQGGADGPVALSAYITKFMSRGFSRPPKTKPVEQDFGCSTMVTEGTDGRIYMGRNFDWDNCRCIIARVNPKHGYRYISAFNPDFFGFGPDWKPEGFANQYLALASLFAALDGVNEKGLAVADLVADENGETHQNNGKPDLTTTCAIKYLLKTAATVNEAIALLDGIDHHSDIGAQHHLAISDATGRSVVVEWLGDSMIVTDTPIVTNHYLCPENFGAGHHEGDCRFETLAAIRDSLDSGMDATQLLDAMSSVWQSWNDETNDRYGGTQWTALFNLSEPGVEYIWRRDTGRRFHFSFL